MLDRRSLLATSAFGAAAAALPGLAHAAPGTHTELEALFDGFFHENLRARPESATQLGLGKGADADLKSKLSDVSRAGQVHEAVLTTGRVPLDILERSVMRWIAGAKFA